MPGRSTVRLPRIGTLSPIRLNILTEELPA
ncbi:hypothetical protein SAMN05216223_10364 [Actinacidiphila yanglinensis]|uniref:Uncharacterized protein n=1 Tax=Actinacidiphila yanglinensis TaxID=310779 RepID=A0A1H5X1G5_9ACTN|nr:hypothetical protein SAMN05216223_10364 [Actinacidiphila yanglinensis]